MSEDRWAVRLLCQDLEKKLSVWFESRVDARYAFRQGFVFNPKTSHGVKFVAPRSLEIAESLTKGEVK